MTYVIAILASVLLLAAFLVLTAYESRRGTRLFEVERAKFDRLIGQFWFLLTHVDFAAFLKEETQRWSTRFGHYVAHLALQSVRAVERLLTRAVKALRAHEYMRDSGPRVSERPFIETLSNFKEHLSATRPDLSQTP